MSSRTRSAVLALVLAGVAAPAAAPAAPATSLSRPPLAAKLTTCDVGADSSGGRAVFTGSMPARRSARRLWMRFDLERRRTGETDWERIVAPTFGQWRKSRVGVSGFVYSKRVEGLPAPATYRAVVRFRWVDARGRTVRRARRSTPSCRQPDPRPNLTVLRLRTAEAQSGPVAEVTVRNTGRADTLAPAVVALQVGDADQPSQTVPALGPGETAVVTFPLETCGPGVLLRVVVDPSDGIDESSETDNERTRVCG